MTPISEYKRFLTNLVSIVFKFSLIAFTFQLKISFEKIFKQMSDQLRDKRMRSEPQITDCMDEKEDSMDGIRYEIIITIKY